MQLVNVVGCLSLVSLSLTFEGSTESQKAWFSPVAMGLLLVTAGLMAYATYRETRLKDTSAHVPTKTSAIVFCAIALWIAFVICRELGVFGA